MKDILEKLGTFLKECATTTTAIEPNLTKGNATVIGPERRLKKRKTKKSLQKLL
jgi:hypothetical protein